MAKRSDFNRPPDPLGQIHNQFSNIDRFLLAQAAAKSKILPEWETLPGLRYLSGFTGIPYSSTRRIVRTGKIPGYKIGGMYFFLIPEIISAINECPKIASYNWLSYEDPESSQDDLKIHWRKYLYPDHVLVKFTYLRWTSAFYMPPEFWRKNSKIIKLMIKAINERHKISPFIHQNNLKNEQ